MTEAKKTTGCLLTRYLHIKSLPAHMRTLALKQWEKDVKSRIEKQGNSVIELSLVVSRA